ncbi:helix-turn-helix domain-containing protein [Salinactinospora qingdaonensis]|uniref:Helix-turn-helix transcriptional regulator n=1 Tax=Salinactinospora qingdaonensis TaxID=702744 RepID=A0ABP7FNM0_9ACTN
MAQRKVTLRAQWLGKLLKELREQNAMTLKEASEYLGRDAPALSRFESGVHPIRRGDVYALMDLYGVEDKTQRDILLQLTGEVAKTGWWEKYSHDLSGGIIDYVWLENRAERLWTFDVTPVHGLLQTAAYAEAWLRAVRPTATTKQVNRWVEMRLRRQEILTRDEPAHLTALMDEAVLRRPVGQRQVMKDQLHHLLDQAQRPNIDLHVLPFASGEHSSPDGGFALIKMSDPFPTIAHAAGPAGTLYVETDDAEQLVSVYDRLRQASLSTEDTITLIASIEKEL